MAGFEYRLRKRGICLAFVDYGDARAGHMAIDAITVEHQSLDRKTRPSYRIRINSGHDPNVQFATLIHGPGHLYLSHPGMDVYLKIPDRSFLTGEDMEVEAESLSFLVCHRANCQFSLRNVKYCCSV